MKFSCYRFIVLALNRAFLDNWWRGSRPEDGAYVSELERRRTAMEEILDQAMRRWRDQGDLTRLSAARVDLTDTSPEWFANRLLKREGFSHPVLERGRDVDQLLRDAEAVAERLRRLPPGICADRLTASYRAKLGEYNRAATAYNPQVPDLLQKRRVDVHSLVRLLAGRAHRVDTEASASISVLHRRRMKAGICRSSSPDAGA